VVHKIGDKMPVWWTTGETDSRGRNIATIIEIKPYRGPFDFVSHIAVLTATTTKRGYVEMSITKDMLD
jgi:hypothetical protein